MQRLGRSWRPSLGMTSVKGPGRATRRPCWCEQNSVCVCLRDSLAWPSASLHFIPILPAHFLTPLFFLTVHFCAALFDNTLEAILDLISLTGNKLQLFCSCKLHFEATTNAAGLANEKNASTSSHRFLPLCREWDNNYCWGAGQVDHKTFTKRVEFCSSPLKFYSCISFCFHTQSPFNPSLNLKPDWWQATVHSNTLIILLIKGNAAISVVEIF